MWPATVMVAGLAWLSGCSRTDSDATDTVTTASPPPVAAADGEMARLRASPQVRDWEDRKRFERDARDFVQRAGSLPVAERESRARRLEAEISERERAGELSAGESMLLRAAMIEAQAGTDEAQARRIAELVQHYRDDAAQREAAWIARQQGDPRMQAYKSREQAVVAEVMAMDTFPDGMTRDQYLRERLQQEREAAWAPGD